MILTTLLRYQRPIIIALLPLLCLLLLDVTAFAQDKTKPSEEAKTANIKWQTKEDVIVINYDLNESSDNKYLVSVVMKREGYPAFSVTPVSTEGDIGTGFFAGVGREIRWYYRRDIPQGLQGTGYYFEFHVKAVKESSSLLYYVVGAVAVTGGLIALLVSRGQDTTVPPLELPTPPGRP